MASGINRILFNMNMIILIFIILIIIAISYNASYVSENFTPKLREMYRPYVRNARVTTEGFYDEQMKNFDVMMKKFGLK